MKLQLLCLATFLTACPAPPEPTKGNHKKQSNVQDVQENKGTKNNPNQQNSGGNEKGSPPENGKDGTPPPENGEPLQDLPPENLDENQEKIEAATLVKPAEGSNDGDGSTIGVYANAAKANNVLQTQKQIEKGEYVTISGQITCEGNKCDSDFVLRLTPFMIPTKDNNPLSQMPEQAISKDTTSNPGLVIDTNNNDFSILTEKRVKNSKAFTILAPKSDQKIILELLLDENKDGKASDGESFVIYEGGGGIELSKDQSDISFKFHPKTMNAPPAGLPN
jgi:hypothetical protein